MQIAAWCICVSQRYSYSNNVYVQVIRSIGYKSLPVDENLPFDTRKSIIPNLRGRVISGKPLSLLIVRYR